jgi:hypothetical protein
MRNKKWVLEHRGGTLKVEQQKLLMKWSLDCVNHLLPILNNEVNDKIKNALEIGNNWIIGKVKTGEAIKIAREIIKYVRKIDNKVEISITRAAGHAVATAHMAEHSMGPVKYGIEALKIIGKPIEPEINWQIGKIPVELKELVLEGLKYKKIINENIILDNM